MSAPGSTHPSRAPGGATLLHRLQQMAAGVKKHGGDPGFPNYFATHDVAAMQGLAGDALVAARAASARARDLLLGMKGKAAATDALYRRGVAAVESFFGAGSPALREFGLRPRKGPDSPRSKQARAARKRRVATAHKKAKKETPAGSGGSASPGQ